MVPENTSISKADALAEAYKRGLLPPDKKAAYEEAMKRGLVQPAAAIAKPAPMSQPDATPWGDGQAFDDMYARKPKTDPMLSPLRPDARTLTSGQPTRMKPPPVRGPVMSPAQIRATQPERDEAQRVNKYNEELALMNAASPIPFKNTGPDGPLELNQERPDRFAGRATGAFVNSNIGVANTLGQLGLSTANAYGAGFDPSMQGALAGGEYGDITQRVADAAQQGGYVQNQQAVGDILPSLPIPAATTPGEMAADVTGNLASVFTGFGAPILKGGKALSESLATVPGMSRTLRGVGVETGENAALAYGMSAGAAPAGSDRNMAGTQGAADPLNYVSIEAARAVPRALKALDAPTTPTNAGGVNLRQPSRQMPPVASAVAATQTAQQAPTQPQTVAAQPVPPTPPNAPVVTASAPQPVPARSRAEQRADDIFMKKMEADGVTVEDIRKVQARLARRGDSGVYETSGELAAMTDNSSGANLRGLQMAGGAAPGPLQEALIGVVNQNADKLSPRITRGATRATGQKADNAVATLDELETRLRTEAAPAYDNAYATPVDPRVFANEIVPVLNTPSGQKALQSARNNLASVAADLQARAARGADERSMMEWNRARDAVKSIDDYMADPVRGTAIPTTMALDYTKRAFDDVIADAGFGSDTARIVGGTKRNFADSVSQATGGEYGNALGVFEDVKRLEDAFEVGTKALNQKTWELRRDMSKGRNGSPWTAGEVEALAMGVARNIEDMIETNNQSALTKLLKDKALKNMATALGSQKAADTFEETIRRLGANREWGRRVAGGSDTAMRQAAIRDAGMEGEDAITRVLDRVETSGNQFSLPGLVNDVAVKPIARTAKDIYQRLRYPGVYDEEVNRALIPLIGKPMTEGNLNEVIRRVEARMAEKGLIPPAQPAAAAAPPPSPGRTRGPRGNPPGTTSSASATGTGIVAGGVLGAMAPAEDENQQLMNALFGAGIGGIGGGVLGNRLARGSTPMTPPPASGASRPPPVRMGFGGRRADPAQAEIDQLGRLNETDTLDTAAGKVSVQFEVSRRNGVQGEDRKVFLLDGKRVGINTLVSKIKEANANRPAQNGFGGKSLPMDEPSRMQRAREQGFDVDTPLYHGTRADFDEFNANLSRSGDEPLGVHLGNVAQANNIVKTTGVAKRLGEEFHEGAAVLPVYARARNPLRLQDPGNWSVGSLRYQLATLPDPIEINKPAWDITAGDIKKAIQDKGYDSIVYRNAHEGDGDSFIIFDPSNIRGKFAKFDPSETQSSKLLAGVSGPRASGIADNLKQDVALAGFGSVGGSFANQEDPQAGALGGMGLALGGKYGPRLANSMRGAGRVKPPPVRGADQGSIAGRPKAPQGAKYEPGNRPLSEIIQRGKPIAPSLPTPTQAAIAAARADTRVSGAATAERLNVIVPEAERVVGGTYTPGAPGGGNWTDLSPEFLAAKGPGFDVTDDELADLWRQSVEASSQAAKNAASKHGVVPTFPAEQWDAAMRLPYRDMLWYELSGEAFGNNLPDLTAKEFIHSMDVVGATSARAKPDENLERTLAAISRNMQGKPIDVDLTQPSAVSQALTRKDLGTSALPGNKTGHFSDTLALTGGVPTRFPISVNDVWVGKMFGIDDTVMSSNQSLHEPMAIYFNKLRDLYNERHSGQITEAMKAANPQMANAPPFNLQSWNFQAPAWVHLRSQTSGAATGDAYHQVWDGIINKLNNAGIPGIDGQKITREALMHPGFADALRRTAGPWRAAPKATIEFGTKLTPVGKAARERFDRAVAEGDELTQREYLKPILSGLYESARGDQPWEKLTKAITGRMNKTEDITRIDHPTQENPLDVGGSFEGDLSPNIRIPLKGLTDSEIADFNAVAGEDLRQAAMAVSQVLAVGADAGEAVREGYIRGLSMFVPTVERMSPADLRALSKALNAEGHTFSYNRYPNGYQFDINPNFDGEMPRGISLKQLDAAFNGAIGADKYGSPTIFTHDYKSVYTEGGDYAGRIEAISERITDDFAKAAGISKSTAQRDLARRSAPAGYSGAARKAWDTARARRDSLADARKQFQALAQKVEDGHAAFLEKVNRRDTKPKPALKSGRAPVKGPPTTAVPVTRRRPEQAGMFGVGGGTRLSASSPKPQGVMGRSPTSGIGRTVAGGAIGAIAGGMAGEAVPQTPETAQKIADNDMLIERELGQIADFEGALKIFSDGTNKEIQAQLDSEGFDLGPTGIDGTLGDITKAAIRGRKDELNASLKTARERLATLEGERDKLKADAAFERTRPTDEQLAFRDYAPLLGGIAGATGAKLFRVGGTTVSKFTAKNAIKKADALLNNAPISPPKTVQDRAEIRKRATNVNEFWQRGGSKTKVPFETRRDGTWIARPLKDVMPPSGLFPDKFIGRKVGAMDALIGGSAVTEAVLAGQNAEMIKEKLNTAYENLKNDKSEENYARVQELEDQYAQAKGLMMLGIGAGIGTGIGVMTSKYASKRANVPKAEEELAILRDYFANQKKPPPKLSPRKKPTTPPPLPPSRPRRNQRPPKP